MKLLFRSATFDLDAKSYVMGILNVTPDSFWDGGRYADADEAVRRAEKMVREGADIIDVGGESTRPAAEPIDAAEELRRVGPVIERLARALPVPISVDTRRARVAAEALSLGAQMINDVSGFAFDPDMAGVASSSGVPVVLMHMRGVPATMQSLTSYGDVIAEVKRELGDRVRVAEDAGVRPENIVIDPGIGFAKTAEQNVEMIARLDEFAEIGKPILVGPSMKSFIGKTLGLGPADRREATIACCVVAAGKGAAIFRVHDVAGVSRALAMADMIERRSRGAGREKAKGADLEGRRR
jgi:dihydropteroate synthase